MTMLITSAKSGDANQKKLFGAEDNVNLYV